MRSSTIESTMKSTEKTMVNLESIPSFVRPLFLLINVDLVPPVIAAERPSPFESCIRTRAIITTQTSRKTILKIHVKASNLLPPIKVSQTRAL